MDLNHPELKIIFPLFFLFPLLLVAQKSENEKPKINWNISSQIWLRYSELNEGSIIHEEPTSNFLDISVRRLRIPISGQVTYAIF